MSYPNRKRKGILDHVLDSGSTKKKKSKVSSLSSSVSSSSVQTNQWLPPISSLLMPLYHHMKPPIIPSPPVHMLPIIPYFFHHKQFGLEACMNQLDYQRQQQQLHSCHNLNDLRFYPF